MRPAVERAVSSVQRSRSLPARAAAWQLRVPVLQAALGAPEPDRPRPVRASGDLAAALGDTVDVRDRAQVWLALSVLTGRFPTRSTVVEVARRGEFDGGATLWATVDELTTSESARWTVTVVSDQVVVDLAHTVSTVLTTGIQRVARETARRWLRDQECLPVAWSHRFQSLRLLTAVERARLDHGAAGDDSAADGPTTVVVPWNATYLLPELGAEEPRTERLLALAELSPNRTGVIGFDCVPITSAETTQRGFAGIFAKNLAAVRHFDRVAAISGAAATEYEGWRDMLAAVGVPGPRIASVPLPVEVATPTEQHLADAAARFSVGSLPLVLVVGSHEPRKNHLAVLHAAELVWREGVAFTLSFVGGNSWGSAPFADRLAELQRAGRLVDTESRLDDDTLWAAYHLARCTVFPSVNEGFGLPVAESLAAGTPAITSDFGSMLELAEGGGAVVVDAHDDVALARALRRVLTEDGLHARLSAEARARTVRRWDDYAAEVWDTLTGAPDRPAQG